MKTMIHTVLALLATGIASAASFTSNSAIKATNDTFPDVAVDVFTPMSGEEPADVPAAVGQFTYNGTTYNYVTSTGNYNSALLNETTITLSELYNAQELDSSLILDSYSFITRSDTSVSNDIYLQVTVGDVTYTSSVVDYDKNATTSGVYGVGTFSFAGLNITLDKDTAYTFTIVQEDGTAKDKIYHGVATCGNYWTDSNNVRQGYTIDDSTIYTWAPVISIATHTAPAQGVPEPATAMLSLFALAGLAARRRRK